MKKMNKKSFSIVLVLAVFAISVFIGCVSPVFAKTASHKLEEYALSYIYYTAWEQCMSTKEFVGGNYRDYIDPQSAIDGRFFSRPAGKARLGYAYGGSWDCNVQGEWLTAALRFWGWQSNSEALTAFGFAMIDGNYKPPDGFDIVTGMKQAIELQYYGTKGRPALSDAQKYVLYYNTFINDNSGCSGKPLVAYSAATVDQKLIPDTDTGYKIKVLDENYKLADVIFQGKTKGTLVDIASDMDTETCLGLSNLINANAESYKKWMSDHKDTENKPQSIDAQIAASGTTSGGTPSSCAIPTVGWIVCPVVTFMSTVADSAYGFIEKNFLVINVDFFSSASTGGDTANAAWSTIRNLTNAGLIVIFLVIIFSQITGFGVSNYGIKKMLPRLVVAAVLINISNIICQLGIELSNLIGKGLYDLLVGQIDNLPGFSGGFLEVGNVWSGIGVAVIGAGVAGAVLYGALGILLPVLLAVVLAILMTLLILVGRQVIIILLFVLSPIAFLLMILPNTESLFKRWRQIFIALLIIYPTIALLFAGSKLASSIITTAYASNNDLTTIQGITGGVIGAAIGILPLFALPWVIRTSLNAVPIVGNMANKWQQRANKAVGGRAKEAYKGTDFARARAVRKDELTNRRASRYAGRVTGGGIRAVPARLAAGRAGGQALGRTAQAAADAADETAVKNADSMLDHAGDNGVALTKDQVTQLALTGSVVGLRRNFSEYDQRAAMQRHIAAAGVPELHDAVTNSSNYSDAVRRTMGKSIAARKDDVPYMNAGLADAVTRGTANAAVLAAEQTATAAKVRPNELATARPEAIAAMEQAAYVEAQNGNNDALTKLQASANYLLTHDDARELRQNIAPNSDLYNSLLGAATVPIP